MAAKKYLTKTAGKTKLASAVDSSAGAGNAGDIVALGSTGTIAANMMPAGYGVDVVSATASETLTAGNWVNLYLDTTLKVRKADATTTGKKANGFILTGGTAGNSIDVYKQGLNNQLTGLTIGTEYYLHTTAGGQTATAPSSTGNVIQSLGIATATTTIFFEEYDDVEIIS